MRTLLMASTALALGALPAMAQTITPTGNFVIPPVGNNGGFESLPVGADVATLRAVMQRNATFASSESGAYTPITLAPGDLTPGTGGSVTDAQGNVYTLPLLGGAWGDSMGGALINGKYTDNALGWVDAIRIVNGVAYFENAKGYGWYDNRGWSVGGDPGSGDPGSASTAATTPSTSVGKNAAPPSATPSAATQTTSASNLQPCAVPDPAALLGYNTPVISGPIDLKGKVWKAIPGANVQNNSDGSITIAGGGSTYNSQVGTVNTISGGFYARATLSWTGDAHWLPGNGWPAFWATNAAGGPQMVVTEADFLEAMGGVTGGLINWLVGGANTQPGVAPPVLSTPAGTDFSKPHTYGFLSIPATVSQPGQAIWYFDGTQTRSISIAPGNGEFSTLATEPLTIMLGSGTVNPMTVYDVQVWQASASGAFAKGSAIGAVYCPGNDGSKGPPTTTTPVTPAPTGKHGRNRAPGSVATAQVSPEQAAAGANDSPAAPEPVYDTTALDAAARAQEAATAAAIAAADAQAPATAALVQQAVTAGQQADSILAGVLAAMEGGK